MGQFSFCEKSAGFTSMPETLSMTFSADRRKFLQTTAVAGVGYWVAGGAEAAESRSPNEKIQLGCIGVGGKGQSDVQNVSKFGQIYALCDVDSTKLDGQAEA